MFVAVAEEEGFAAGARRLEMSAPPVTRAVSSLEQRLGAKLLNRSTRYVRLTDAGKRYLPEARRILDELQTADELVRAGNTSPTGSLAITAPVEFGTLHVIPGVVEYLQRYPDTTVSVALLDRVVNLLEEGFDAGIRIGELPDSSMHAVRVGSVRSVVCASPQYLKANGTPNAPEHLSNHQIVSVGGSTERMQWRFQCKGKVTTVRLKPRLSVSNISGSVAAVCAGFGIVRLLSYQVENHLNEGRLKLLLEDYESPPLPVHIIHREGRVLSSKLRAFIDLMSHRLRANKLINDGVSAP